MNKPVIEKTTDFMWTANEHGLSLFKFKGCVCMTVYESAESQVFYTEEMQGVLMKKEEKVYHLTDDAWTKMVLKIESEIDYSMLNPKASKC